MQIRTESSLQDGSKEEDHPQSGVSAKTASRKICIMGLGYIGLPTAALLANRGHDVHGVDVVPRTVDIINRGEIHIAEPELNTLVHAAVNSGRLKAGLMPAEADIFIIAVPTPLHLETATPGYTPQPDTDYIISAARSIAPYVQEGNIVVLESTSPVGSTEKVEEILADLRPDLFPETGTRQSAAQRSKLFVAHCPERVLPGHIMREIVENDRIVGGTTPEATKAAAAFYKTFVSGEVLETDAKTAEMTKLAENAFRDTNIAFANELSMLCDRFGIDVWELIRLANRHPRVNILQPGAGVGGHCIAVDPWFLVYAGGDDARLIRSAREVNTYKTEWVVEKIKNSVNAWKLNYLKEHQLFTIDQVPQPQVACMGLAFKPDIDDLRESPALYIAARLSNELENVAAVEPNISIDNPELTTQYPRLKLVELGDALASSDIFAFLVAHKEFKALSIKTDLDFCGVINTTS